MTVFGFGVPPPNNLGSTGKEGHEIVTWAIYGVLKDKDCINMSPGLNLLYIP